MQNSSIPPEVAAARGLSQLPTIPVKARIEQPLVDLLNRMNHADEVYILGNLPWECSKELIELQQGNPKSTAKEVHYFISDQGGAKNAGAPMAPQIQQWIAGRFGVRNWVMPNRDESANRDKLIMYKYRYDAGGCFVFTREDGYELAAIINYLPVAGLPTTGVLTSAEYPAAQRNVIRDHLFGDLMVNSRPYEVRRLRCVGPAAGRRTDSFSPVLLGLTTRRALGPEETEPAVVVAICGNSPEGPVVMLKRRTRANAIDDFGKLSLVSEHVIAEDLTDWLPPHGLLDADDKQAMEQLWTKAQRPSKLELTDAFFAEAAQRELFLSCGLNVPADRLRFCGFRLVDREDRSHLGFGVFRLDLIQEGIVDELRIVREWSRDMEQVPIARLYQDPYAKDLNRLLSLQRNWLLQNVFKPRPRVPRQP